jgi:hypothetical protein
VNLPSDAVIVPIASGYVCEAPSDPMASAPLVSPVVGIAYDRRRDCWRAVVLDHKGHAVFADGQVNAG